MRKFGETHPDSKKTQYSTMTDSLGKPSIPPPSSSSKTTITELPTIEEESTMKTTPTPSTSSSPSPPTTEQQKPTTVSITLEEVFLIGQALNTAIEKKIYNKEQIVQLFPIVMKFLNMIYTVEQKKKIQTLYKDILET